VGDIRRVLSILDTKAGGELRNYGPRQLTRPLWRTVNHGHQPCIGSFVENECDHLLLLLPICRRSIFIYRYQGVRHAQRPKDNQEYAPTQTGVVICRPLEAMDTETWQLGAEVLAKRAKKL
jgi:hypothetical protein